MPQDLIGEEVLEGLLLRAVRGCESRSEPSAQASRQGLCLSNAAVPPPKHRDLVARYLRAAWDRFDKPDVPVKVGSGAQCQGQWMLLRAWEAVVVAVSAEILYCPLGPCPELSLRGTAG